MTTLQPIPFPIPKQVSPHVLYRLFAADGTLLYVGITNELRRRCREHSYKTWFTEVASIDVTPFQSQERAAAIEALVIAEHAPKYNRAGGSNIASSPGRKATGAASIPLRVPVPLYRWLRAQADMSHLEITEVILRHLEHAREMDGLTPEMAVSPHR